MARSGKSGVRARARRLLGRLVPRAVSDPLRALHASGGDKRLDLSCAQLVHALQGAGVTSVEGLRCLELGAGWVLSHSLALHLLGAREVVATDVAHHARLFALRRAVHASVPSMVRDQLAPLAEHERVRERLERVRELQVWSWRSLRELGLRYRAPHDLTVRPLGEPVDLIVSNSVLEHVPAPDLPRLLVNLRADLRPGGRMVHLIHLEDHLDSQRDPFRFLEPQPWSALDAARRGNRLRASAWAALFDAVPDATWRAFYTWRRSPALLPGRIDPALSHTGPDDLRVSHLGVVVEADPGRA